MLSSYIQSNPLIQSVLHKPLRYAISEIGLPALPEQSFINQITPYLQSVGIAADEFQGSLSKLWKSVLCGEVIATELWNDTWPVFYVRGGFGGRGIDVRLICREHEWQIESVTAMYARPIIQSRWFHRSSFAAAVVCAAIMGYAIHQPTQPLASSPTTHVVPPTAPPAVGEPPLSAANSQPSASKPGANAPLPRDITFTLAQGMPLFDLSRYLQAQHLVKDAMAFDMVMKRDGVDRNLKPGVYTFNSNMSQSDLINVLRQGPAQ